jgi:hypothetical protein
MMAEKDAGTRFWVGLCLVLAALPVNLSWVFWRKLKSRLSAGTLVEMSAIATSPRWWFGALFILLAALIFMPVIQVPRWPTWPFSRTELTTIPTKLRLQFNEAGVNPEEIENHNLKWTWFGFSQQRKGPPTQKYVCDVGGMDKPLFGQTTTILSPTSCTNVDFPNFSDVQNGLIFLSFTKPISTKSIQLNSHGATLPKWEVHALSSNLGYIYFHGDLTRMILDIEVAN